LLKSIYQKFVRSTFFEKLLLFVGAFVGIVGFYLINTIYMAENRLTWALIQSVFLWLLLILILVLTDSSETIKNELSVVIKDLTEETRLLKKEVELLREITKEQMEEIKLLRKNQMFNTRFK